MGTIAMKTILLALLLCGLLLSQPPPATVDPNVYMGFFHFHHGLNTWLDGKKAKEHGRADVLDAGTAKLLKMDKAELNKLRIISDRVVADLEKTEDDAQALIQAAKDKKKNPDASALQQLALKRQAIVLTAIGDLKSTLSAASWQGFQSYIENEYKPGIHKF